MKNVLITGTSSGLGEALAKQFFKNNYNVYGISRSQTNTILTKSEICDFSVLSSIEGHLEKLTKDVDCFDYIFLNAGILGELAPSSGISLKDYEKVFNINVWSNKIIIDNLINSNKAKNIIAISSGAALKSYFGWSLYCSSKAAFKQLISCYAQEYSDINFLSLAPGLIKTKMQHLINSYDEKNIPSVKRFKESYDTMQSPDDCAQIIYKSLISILECKESFLDLRNL